MNASITDDDYVYTVRTVRSKNQLATAVAISRELGLCSDEGSHIGSIREHLDRLVAAGRLASGDKDWQFMASAIPTATGETYYWPIR